MVQVGVKWANGGGRSEGSHGRARSNKIFWDARSNFKSLFFSKHHYFLAWISYYIIFNTYNENDIFEPK